MQHDKDFKGGEQNVLRKRWNKDSFTGELFCSYTRLVKHYSWRLISNDYVETEQVLGVLNAYDKNLLHECHYRLFKCFESAKRTTDGEFCVILSKRRMTYPEILAQKFIFYP